MKLRDFFWDLGCGIFQDLVDGLKFAEHAKWMDGSLLLDGAGVPLSADCRGRIGIGRRCGIDGRWSRRSRPGPVNGREVVSSSQIVVRPRHWTLGRGDKAGEGPEGVRRALPRQSPTRPSDGAAVQEQGQTDCRGLRALRDYESWTVVSSASLGASCCVLRQRFVAASCVSAL